MEKHTEQNPTDAYGVINFQGGSHSYRSKVCDIVDFLLHSSYYLNNTHLLSGSLCNAMSENQSQPFLYVFLVLYRGEYKYRIVTSW